MRISLARGLFSTVAVMAGKYSPTTKPPKRYNPIPKKTNDSDIYSYDFYDPNNNENNDRLTEGDSDE